MRLITPGRWETRISGDQEQSFYVDPVYGPDLPAASTPAAPAPVAAAPAAPVDPRAKIAASLGIPIADVVPNYATEMGGPDGNTPVQSSTVNSYSVKRSDTVGLNFDRAGNQTGSYTPVKPKSEWESFRDAAVGIGGLGLAAAGLGYGLPAILGGGAAAGGAGAAGLAAGELGLAASAGAGAGAASSGFTLSGLLSAPGTTIGSALGITNPYVAQAVGNTIIQTATNGGDVGKAIQNAALSAGLNFVGAGVSGAVKEALSDIPKDVLSDTVKTGIAKGVTSAATAGVTGRDPIQALVGSATGTAVGELVKQIPGLDDNTLPPEAKQAATSAVTAALTGKDVTAATLNAALNAGTKAVAGYADTALGLTPSTTAIADAYNDPSRLRDVPPVTAPVTDAVTSPAVPDAVTSPAITATTLPPLDSGLADSSLLSYLTASDLGVDSTDPSPLFNPLTDDLRAADFEGTATTPPLPLGSDSNQDDIGAAFNPITDNLTASDLGVASANTSMDTTSQDLPANFFTGRGLDGGENSGGSEYSSRDDYRERPDTSVNTSTDTWTNPATNIPLLGPDSGQGVQTASTESGGLPSILDGVTTNGTFGTDNTAGLTSLIRDNLTDAGAANTIAATTTGGVYSGQDSDFGTYDTLTEQDAGVTTGGVYSGEDTNTNINNSGATMGDDVNFNLFADGAPASGGGSDDDEDVDISQPLLTPAGDEESDVIDESFLYRLSPTELENYLDLNYTAPDYGVQDLGVTQTNFDEFNQNFNPDGGFSSGWQTVGTDRIFINDDGTGSGINENGEAYSLTEDEVTSMITNGLLNARNKTKTKTTTKTKTEPKPAATGTNKLTDLLTNPNTAALLLGAAVGAANNAEGVTPRGLRSIATGTGKQMVQTGAKGTGGKGGVRYFEKKAAGGSIDGYARGGGLGYLKSAHDGMEDQINATIDNKRPAKLSGGEFVVPADVVSHLGNGNSEAGAKQLYALMERVRKARTGTAAQGKQINPKKYLPR